MSWLHHSGIPYRIVLRHHDSHLLGLLLLLVLSRLVTVRKVALIRAQPEFIKLFDQLFDLLAGLVVIDLQLLLVKRQALAVETKVAEFRR
jgi:hypothetical protein